MDTKTNTKIMTAMQARENTRCSGKTLEFMERLINSVKEEIEQRASNGYLNGNVLIFTKRVKINYVAAVEEIVKKLEELGYYADWNWMVEPVTGMNNSIQLFFSWRE